MQKIKMLLTISAKNAERLQRSFYENAESKSGVVNRALNKYYEEDEPQEAEEVDHKAKKTEERVKCLNEDCCKIWKIANSENCPDCNGTEKIAINW